MPKLPEKDSLIKKYLSVKNIKEALKIQTELKQKLKIESLKKEIKKIAAFDASFKEDVVSGGACVVDNSGLNVVEEKVLKSKVVFPYIPGFFAFREGPMIVELFYSLKNRPDLIILDAQGIAHPQGLGLASHLGIILNIPSIGCSKNNLYGNYKKPAQGRGNFTFIIEPKSGKKIGAVLRTKDKTKPLFISPGHLIDIDSSINIVNSLCTKFRSPDVLRKAHSLTYLPL